MSDIEERKHLEAYLYRALQLEHATIPVYLTALYSLHPQTNSDAYHVLRVVVVEEMLHLTLAANLMNAIGGEVDLTKPGFVPSYPTELPDGEDDFQVHLACFSPATLETFLKIERPTMAPDKASRRTPHGPGHRSSLGTSLLDPETKFYSIGDFYEEIAEGFCDLHEKLGDELFSGDPTWQASAEYYYSGGGDLRPVTDLTSALSAIDLIKGQGEGDLAEPYDVQGELAHYYRLEQLKIGKYYLPGDVAGNPRGPGCSVDWTAVYPTITDPRLESYRADEELFQVAEAFNRTYAEFLGTLTAAFKGQPQLLLEAVPDMFRLRNAANQIVRNPVAGSHATHQSAASDPEDGPAHAAPTFEIPGTPQ